MEVKTVIFNKQRGKLLDERVGRMLVEWPDGSKQWLLKGVPGVEIIETVGRGRPRSHQSNAEKQKAYRERQKALRKSESG